VTMQTAQTTADLERQLAAARARLAEIPGELAEAEVERDRLYEGWLASKALVEEAGRVLLGVSDRLRLGAEEIITTGGMIEQRDRAGAEEAERRQRQARAGWELAREEEGAALLSYNRANRRCGALLAERNRLEYHLSVWERELAATHRRDEAGAAQRAEARSWLDKVRTGLLGARA
jgi:hypothetical protein